MPEAGSAPVETSDVGEPLDGLTSMPDVQRHAIDAAENTRSQATAQTGPWAMGTIGSGLVDAQGRAFDPALHETDPATSEPRLTTTGKLRLKRGRGGVSAKVPTSGFKVGATSGPTVPGPSGAQVLAERNAKIESTALITAEMIFMCGKLIGGEEWEPKVDKSTGLNERDIMKSAWAEYYRARGIIDLPPELMLAVAVGSYAVPRFFQPKTKTRLQKGKEWFYQYLARRKARKNGWTARETQVMDEAAFTHPMQP